MKREFLDAWFYNDKELMHSLMSKMGEEEVKVAEVLRVFESASDEILLQQKFEFLLRVFESKVSDIDFQTVLLYVLGEISFRCRKMHDFDRIDKIFSNLELKKITKHFQALFYIHKSVKELVEINKVELIDFLNKAEEFLPEGCERWYKTIARKVLHSILDRIPLNVEAYVEKLEAYPHLEHLSFSPKYFLARYYELQGNHYKAIDILKPIYENGSNSSFYQNYFASLVNLYSLIGDHESGNRELENYLKKYPDFLSTDPGKIFLIEKARAQNDPSTVKLYAKELLTKNKLGLVSRTWVLYLLLSAEILEGATVAAKRILKSLDPKGEKPSFYSEWVRIYLLEGDENKAAFYFRKLIRLKESFIFEFMHAYELRYCQILKLHIKTNYEDHSSQIDLKKEQLLIEVDNETSIGSFIGKSQVVAFVKENIKKFGPLEIPVLITGETGTGKEDVARLLHQQSTRSKEPFIPVNCGGISSTLIEAELFGYQKGAYTGAVKDHKGLFEAAGNGTIFLDEISAMPLSLQASLLRVLETMKVRPIGSTEHREVKARVIVATNIRLEKLMEEQKFRADLYFRLNRLQINLPALRDRKEDIPLLISHFLKKYNIENQVRIDDELMKQMQAYHWPGNVRELKNEVERMVVLAGDGEIITSQMIHFLHDKAIAKQSIELPKPTISAPFKSSNLNQGISVQNGYEEARLQSLIQLFRDKKHLTRAMVARALGCAPNTAANDLKKLNELGIITRVLATASVRSSYYQIIES
jgi:DNA-binding NtrC family response regulator